MISRERGLALKAAVELALRYVAPDTTLLGTVDGVLELADRVVAWIAGTPPAQAQTSQGTGGEHSAAPAGEEPDWTAFWARARAAGFVDRAGHSDTVAVARKLGMMPDAWLRANPGKTLEDAARLLEAKP